MNTPSTAALLPASPGRTRARPAPLAGTTAEMRAWLALAVCSLAVASLLALVLAASRTPHVIELLPADWDRVFRRVLVTHVIFSFVIWCLAVLGSFGAMTAARPSRAGVGAAWAGAALLVVTTVAGLGEPVVSDYVPVLFHPLYGVGLALLAAGVASVAARAAAGAWRRASPEAVSVGVAALAALAAFACIALTLAALPPDLTPHAYSQLLFWGGGHVLQFAHAALTLGIWYGLSIAGFGTAPLSPRAFAAALAVLVPFVLVGPALLPFLDVTGPDYLSTFTDLMVYGAAVPPLVVGAAVARVAWRKRERWSHPAATALLLSLLLFGLGGLAGFFLPAGDTRTPAHYHASLSAVNLALMAGIWFRILPALGCARPRDGLVRLQLWSFGLGQLVFALGMFVAGAEGVPRKTAGLAQGLDSAVKETAMGIAGIGGLIAVAGALLFVALVLRRMYSGMFLAASPDSEEEVPWHRGC